MALPSTAVIEVRTTGSSTQCAGGFNSARGGTDYSQQNAAQATGTVTSSTTTVTATTGIFTSAMVGNYITDGTTFKEITAFTSSTVVTVDSSPSWTAATIYVGGALATLAKAAAIQVAGNTVYVKAGTYTIVAAIAPAAGGTLVVPITWQGYNATRGDLTPTSPSTNAPLVTTATNSISIVSGNTAAMLGLVIQNINFSNTAAVRASFSLSSTNTGYSQLIACKLTGFAGLSNSGDSAQTHANCEFSTFTAAVYTNTIGGAVFTGCWAHNGTDFIATGNGNGMSVAVTVLNCVVSNMTGWFINSSETFNTNWIVESCSTYLCAGGFIQMAATSGSTSYNRIFLKNNVTWGVTSSKIIKNNDTNGRTLVFAYAANAVGGPTTSYTNLTAPSTDLTITASPFTNTAGNDYSLNNTASAGASCRQAAFPGTLGSSVGYRDLGAFQHLPNFPSVDTVLNGTSFDDGNLSGDVFLPSDTSVLADDLYGPALSLIGVLTVPLGTQVLTNVFFGPNLSVQGNVSLPAVSDVKTGVHFGANNTSVGTLVSGGGGGILGG